MATRNPKNVSDGFLSLEGGVDSGRAPNLLNRNQVAWAINSTCRGGWRQPRPGWQKKTLDFSGSESAETGFKTALFQTVGGYTADDGSGWLISMQGGRMFRTSLTNFVVQEITISGDVNSPVRQQAWTMQAENYFLIQNDLDKVFLWDGATARRLTEREIPVGRQMTYYMGRIVVAKGRSYVAGDIVYGPSGTSANGYRDAILKMAENQFLETGGAFAVPVNSGDIIGLKPIANINTALGQGELIVYCQNSVFATILPVDRTTWQTLTQPLQRIIQLASGARSQNSIVNVNEDHFYRSANEIRSLAYAVRNSGQWGNTPISNEVTRILSRDADSLLRFASGVSFQDRLLMTASPKFKQGHGTYHRCLVGLDFEPITSMQGKTSPAWEGIWTGLNILQVVNVLHFGVERCFLFVLNRDDQIEIWEITKDERFDNNGEGDVRIQWSFESRSMDFGAKFDRNELFSGDLFFDRVAGQVDFDLKYRPDSYPCWIDWETWSECGKYAFCEDDFGECPSLPNFQEQYRPNRQVVQPADSFDPITRRKYRTGFEFQTRLAITGFCRVKQCRFNAYQTEQLPYGEQL